MFVLSLTLLPMSSKQLTPEQQLNLIETTLAKTRENLSHYSFDFLFWGWLIFCTALLNFIGLNYTELGVKSYFIWGVSPLLGCLFVANYHSKQSRVKTNKTHFEFFMQELWIVIGSVMILFSLSSFFIPIKPLFFFPVLAGIGTLVSGLVLRFRLLIFGGVLLLLFPFIVLQLSDSWNMLLYGLVVFVSFALPGYALRKAVR